MPKRIRFGALFVAFLSLTGCGSKPFTQDALTASELPASARIGVLPVNYLAKPSVDVHDNPVGLAGTAGKLAVIKGRDTKRRKFTTALEDLRFSYQVETNAVLMDRLHEAGLDARFMEFQRSIDNILEAVPPRRFEKRYPKDAPFDALLDIYVDYAGYAAPALGDSYMPTVHIAARMVDASSHNVLYESRIQYHPLEEITGESVIDADASYAFENFDALLEDVPRARDGLQTAVDAVLDRLIEELKAH
jgi:hypothetical protein